MGRVSKTVDWRQVGVFDGVTAGLSAIWLMNDDGSSMHRLNTSSTREYMPTWSRDGHWIYYCSLKGGEDRLLKQNPDTGEIVEVNDASFYDAREDRDHGALYAERNDGRLWEIPLSRGAPALAPGTASSPVSRYWTIAGNGLYFVRAEDRSYALQRYDLAAKTTQLVGHLASEVLEGTPGLSIDPAEHYLLFVQRDQDRSTIMLEER